MTSKFQQELIDAALAYAEIYGQKAPLIEDLIERTKKIDSAYLKFMELVRRAVDGGCKNPNCDIRQRHEHSFGTVVSVEDIFVYE